MAGGAVGWAAVAVAAAAVLPAVVAATTHTIELEFDGYARKVGSDEVDIPLLLPFAAPALRSRSTRNESRTCPR